jgi:uncharacterized protein
MKLIFPQEIEVWYVLPLIRKNLALELVKNLKQKEVAEMMGITSAAISQYKKDKRAKNDFFNQEMKDELEKSVKTIIKDNSKLSEEIIRLNNLAKKKGLVCKMYSEICALNNNKEKCPYCNKNG